MKLTVKFVAPEKDIYVAAGFTGSEFSFSFSPISVGCCGLYSLAVVCCALAVFELRYSGEMEF